MVTRARGRAARIFLALFVAGLFAPPGALGQVSIRPDTIVRGTYGSVQRYVLHLVVRSTPERGTDSVSLLFSSGITLSAGLISCSGVTRCGLAFREDSVTGSKTGLLFSVPDGLPPGDSGWVALPVEASSEALRTNVVVHLTTFSANGSVVRDSLVIVVKQPTISRNRILLFAVLAIAILAVAAADRLRKRS
jgi:hypothetical protein